MKVVGKLRVYEDSTNTWHNIVDRIESTTLLQLQMQQISQHLLAILMLMSQKDLALPQVHKYIQRI